jgi:hypothetical protein
MTLPLRTIRRGAAAVAVAAAVLVPAAPAFAFHHVGVPGSACGNGEWAGGNNPTARQALLDAGHTLPLPPNGVTDAPTETPAMARCAAE